MLRRSFIKNVSGAGGALVAGVVPLAAAKPDDSPAERFSSHVLQNAANGKRKGRAVSEVRQYNGKPTVFVNGKACFPMAYLSYYPAQFRYENLYKSNVGFFSLSVSLGDRFVAAYRNGRVKPEKMGIWDGPDHINFGQLDQSILEILKVAPDAYIFPRIFCDSPSWWDSAHPSETSRTFDGLSLRQSFSSLVWRNDTVDVLRQIVRHLSEAQYADRIIGIHVSVGETEESVHHDWLGAADYSIAAQKQFREWLIERYGSEENIQAIFKKKPDELMVPSPEDRSHADFGRFYDPEKSSFVMAYNTFKCEEVVDVLECLCRAVKEESHKELLTGVFFGYTLVEWRDHLALSLLLKSPYIDFLSNTNGAGRLTQLGVRDMHFLSETDSIHKANKLFYYEADTRTCMSKWISQLRPDVDPYHEYDLANWLGPETIQGTLQLLKAVFSRVICTGSVNWWFDLWGGWYDHPKILALFSEMQKIGVESIHLPRQSVSEVCVIVSEKSLLYFATATRTSSWIHQQMEQIGRIGAPYDIYLLKDLKDIDLSRYKMLIFLNALALSDDEISIIRERCMGNGRILLWLYGAAIFDNSISIARMSSFLEMEIGYREIEGSFSVDVSLDNEKFSYKSAEVSPLLYIKSGATSIYGETPDNEAVMAEKKSSLFSNILACLPPLPWQLIQCFAIRANVHIYSDSGDVVYANQSYLSISAAKSGKRVVRLPKRAGLRELLESGSNELSSNQQHEIEFTEHSCKFFQLG